MAKWSDYNFAVADGNHTIMYNARTGAMARMAHERIDQIEAPETLDDAFVDFLLSQGFLVSDDTNEIDLIAQAHEQARETENMFSATIELTETCNFRCQYCYQPHEAKNLEPDAEQRIIKYLKRRLRDVPHLHLNWFGGEPLIKIDVLERIAREMTDEAKKTGHDLSQFITTNGYLLDHAMAHRLATIGIENVQITLDGDQQTHDALRPLSTGKGTYQKVLAACGHVVAAGMELMVRINVTKWNAGRVGTLLDDLAEHGVSPVNTVIHAVRAIDHGNCAGPIQQQLFTNADFAKAWIGILGVVKSHGYGLPSLAPRAYNCTFDLHKTVMIGGDGSLRHCSSSSGLLGRIGENGEETDPTALLQTIKERRPLDDTRCRACRYLPMCMGGCSYLQEIGQEKCNPETHVLPELLSLSAQQASS